MLGKKKPGFYDVGWLVAEVDARNPVSGVLGAFRLRQRRNRVSMMLVGWWQRLSEETRFLGWVARVDARNPVSGGASGVGAF